MDSYEAMETYSRIGLLRSYGNLQSYCTTTKLWKLSVVLGYYEAMETYSRIGLYKLPLLSHAEFVLPVSYKGCDFVDVHVLNVIDMTVFLTI